MTLNERMGYKCSPAMAAGLASHVWTVAELLEQATVSRHGTMSTGRRE
jgi:hypothetical protein